MVVAFFLVDSDWVEKKISHKIEWQIHEKVYTS
jgi:hypothetical protein